MATHQIPSLRPLCSKHKSQSLDYINLSIPNYPDQLCNLCMSTLKQKYSHLNAGIDIEVFEYKLESLRNIELHQLRESNPLIQELQGILNQEKLLKANFNSKLEKSKEEVTNELQKFKCLMLNMIKKEIERVDNFVEQQQISYNLLFDECRQTIELLKGTFVSNIKSALAKNPNCHSEIDIQFYNQDQLRQLKEVFSKYQNEIEDLGGANESNKDQFRDQVLKNGEYIKNKIMESFGKKIPKITFDLEQCNQIIKATFNQKLVQCREQIPLSNLANQTLYQESEVLSTDIEYQTLQQILGYKWLTFDLIYNMTRNGSSKTDIMKKISSLPQNSKSYVLLIQTTNKRKFGVCIKQNLSGNKIIIDRDMFMFSIEKGYKIRPKKEVIPIIDLSGSGLIFSDLSINGKKGKISYGSFCKNVKDVHRVVESEEFEIQDLEILLVDGESFQ